MTAWRKRGERRSQDRRWLRVAAAAEILEVSEHTLRRWADAGVVPCRRTPSGQRQFLPRRPDRFLGGATSHGSGTPEPAGRGPRRPAGTPDGGPLVDVSRAAAPGRPQDPRADALEPSWRRSCAAGARRRGVPRSASTTIRIDALVRAGREHGARRPPAWPSRSGRRSGRCSRAASRCTSRSRLCVPFGLGPATERLHRARPAAARRPPVGRGASRWRATSATSRPSPSTALQAEPAASTSRRRAWSRCCTPGAASRPAWSCRTCSTRWRARWSTPSARGYCVIWEFVEDEDALRGTRRLRHRTTAYTIDGDVMLLAERPREREILFSSEPVLETLSDPELDRESRESMERWGEKTCLSLPLRFGEVDARACWSSARRSASAVSPPRSWSWPRASPTQASAAVHNARVYRDLERAQRGADRTARAASGC